MPNVLPCGFVRDLGKEIKFLFSQVHSFPKSLTKSQGETFSIKDLSTIIVRSKSFPPVSLLLTQLTMRVISARSFGSLDKLVICFDAVCHNNYVDLLVHVDAWACCVNMVWSPTWCLHVGKSQINVYACINVKTHGCTCGLEKVRLA